ncbi:MAG: crossover junction endodeoxyribonuclease RuvC [Gemmataceae bacterium]|nr:crossover junction endodeoxyribonuclease RuvC [Gemmataceae bacterium]
MTSSAKIILGLDPGLQVTGYALLEEGHSGPRVREAGVIRVPQRGGGDGLAHRLQHLYDSVVELVEQFRPAVLAVEQLYAHYKHPRTAILMGHARGVLLLAGAQRGLQVASFPATTVKKTITGNGRAPKSQMQLAVQRELGLACLPEPSDVADALAVALCQYHRQRAKPVGRPERHPKQHEALDRSPEDADD